MDAPLIVLRRTKLSCLRTLGAKRAKRAQSAQGAKGVFGPLGCAVLLALACGAAQPQALAHAAAPQRIVSLLPSATEAVCALGACDRLVGTDAFSQDPPEVRPLPKLGKTWQPDLEAIVRLRPNLVLIGRNPAVAARLRAAGLPFLITDASNLQGVHAMLIQIDQALQTNRAPAVWQGLQSELRQVAQQQAAFKTPPRVYLEVDGAMFAAGARSFMGELLTQLGLHNIAPDDGHAFSRVSPEYVLRAQPDLIILAYHGSQIQPLHTRPGWQHLHALQHRNGLPARVCQLSDAQTRTVTRPGPRLAEAARIFADCLNLLQPPAKPSSPTLLKPSNPP